MTKNKSKQCKLCKNLTPIVFNLNFKAVPICENCATKIFIQQAQWYTQQDYTHLYKEN